METPNCPMCQSCGMPMCKPEDFGTEADGQPSKEYCAYCYQKGAYTKPDISMEEMKEWCIKGMMETGQISADEAKKTADEYLPKLKRWQA
jgi:hypothetical protein